MAPAKENFYYSRAAFIKPFAARIGKLAILNEIIENIFGQMRINQMNKKMIIRLSFLMLSSKPQLSKVFNSSKSFR